MLEEVEQYSKHNSIDWKAMSLFCTSCGAASSGARFCTSCGTPAPAPTPGSAPAPTPAPTPVVTPVTETAWTISEGSVASDFQSSSSENQAVSSKKKLLLIAAAVVLFVGTGVGAFLAGKSSADLEKERKAAYDSGFSDGDSAGFNRGDSAGYDRGYGSGKIAGCREVFSFSDGTFDYLVPYDPNSYDKYPGSYYTERSDC